MCTLCRPSFSGGAFVLCRHGLITDTLYALMPLDLTQGRDVLNMVKSNIKIALRYPFIPEFIITLHDKRP